MSYNFEVLDQSSQYYNFFISANVTAKYLLDGIFGQIIAKKISTVEEEEKKLTFIKAMINSFKHMESQLPFGLTCAECYFQLAEFAYMTNQRKLKAFFREKLVECGCDVSKEKLLNEDIQM
jgi:bacterioferritin-associated ferredoxin